MNTTSLIVYSSEKSVNLNKSKDSKSNKKIIIKKTVSMYNKNRSKLILTT